MYCSVLMLAVPMQFQYCLSQFQTLADDLSKLYASLFDADPTTLQYVSLYPPQLVGYMYCVLQYIHTYNTTLYNMSPCILLS